MHMSIHDFVVISCNNNCSHFAENLALRKPTWQFPSFYGANNFGDLAVDGKKSNLYWFGGECSVSAIFESTVEWWVDLGEVLSIHHIFIQYAKNNLVWGEQFSTELFFSVYKKDQQHIHMRSLITFTYFHKISIVYYIRSIILF